MSLINAILINFYPIEKIKKKEKNISKHQGSVLFHIYRK